MPAAPSNAVLPPNSLVLVTGANGFVGCEVVNQLLAHEFRVRGTVRDVHKSKWVQDHFDSVYGSDKFELVAVKDVGAEGSLDEAVKGCDGVVHVASNVTFSPDPNIVVNEAVAFAKSALESSVKEPKVKRFVMTSSSSAANQLKFNEPYDLTPESWNTKSVEIAWAPPPYGQDRMMHTYNASKVQSEQALWKFMEERKPNFVANTVLPDFVTGRPVNLGKQGYASSLGVLNALWNNNDMWKMLYPQHMIDSKDTALLHVGALVHPDYKGERIFGYAHRKSWTDWIQRLGRMYPEHKFPDPPGNEGEDLANVTDKPRAEALLKWLGRPGWTPMEESLKEVCDTMV